MEQKNDYVDAYKPVESTPPPPRARAGQPETLEAMAARLGPEGARKVLAFMEAHQNYKQMPEHVMAQLIAKANQGIEPEAHEPAEATAEREQTAKAVEGSSQLNPPMGGIFPDGSKLSEDENGQPWPF